MKKKLIITLAIITLLVMGASSAYQYTKLATSQNVWRVLEACTSAGAEATALDVDERTFQTVLDKIIAAGDRTTADGEIEWFIVPPEWNRIRLSAIGITDNATYTVDVFAGTLGGGIKVDDNLYEASIKPDNCNLTHIGTLAFVIGTQVSTTTSYEMADAVTVTTKDSTVAWASVSNAGDDTCEAMIDLQGADVLIFVPTTCTANSKLLAKGY